MQLVCCLVRQNTACTALDPIRVPFAGHGCITVLHPVEHLALQNQQSSLSCLLEQEHLQTRIGQGMPNPEKGNGVV